MGARDSLRMATMGGARCLGRDAELGSLEPGKAADLAVWRIDHLPGAGIADPVATLGFGAPELEHLFVGGQQGVAGGGRATPPHAAGAPAPPQAEPASAPGPPA